MKKIKELFNGKDIEKSKKKNEESGLENVSTEATLEIIPNKPEKTDEEQIADQKFFIKLLLIGCIIGCMFSVPVASFFFAYAAIDYYSSDHRDDYTPEIFAGSGAVMALSALFLTCIYCFVHSNKPEDYITKETAKLTGNTDNPVTDFSEL